MSYNSDLQTNNIALQQILNIVNALPEAGEDVTLQEKTVTPTKSQQQVTADAGFTGLSSVKVEAIPNEYIVPSGTLDIKANGSYDVTDKAGVVVSVDAPLPVLQEKTATPSASDQEITADNGYDGLSKVTVEGDANLSPENIKSGASIFGVGGTFTSDASVTDEKVFLGETYYANGEKGTGTFTIAEEIASLDARIDLIKTALQGKASGGVGTTEIWTFTLEDGTEIEKEVVVV